MDNQKGQKTPKLPSPPGDDTKNFRFRFPVHQRIQLVRLGNATIPSIIKVSRIPTPTDSRLVCIRDILDPILLLNGGAHVVRELARNLGRVHAPNVPI